MSNKYVPTEREQAFLDTVVNPKYNRQIINGLDPFIKSRAFEEMGDFYSRSELDSLLELRGTERDVEARMPVKITRHYFELARRSPSLQRLVKASPDETLDALLESREPWLNACALHIIGAARIEGRRDTPGRHLQSTDPIVRDTAQWAKLQLSKPGA